MVCIVKNKIKLQVIIRIRSFLWNKVFFWQARHNFRFYEWVYMTSILFQLKKGYFFFVWLLCKDSNIFCHISSDSRGQQTQAKTRYWHIIASEKELTYKAKPMTFFLSSVNIIILQILKKKKKEERIIQHQICATLEDSKKAGNVANS